MMYSTQPDISQTRAPSLALSGSNGYDVQGDRVVITASEIANNRDAGDVSGTLSIELWALNQPYQGDSFNGVALAGTQIGELFGQHYLADCYYDLVFNEPGPGTWYLTLMLREWTDAGFVTRDYVNFAQPYLVARKPAVVQSKVDNVINVSFPAKDKPQPAEAVAEQPALEAPRKEKDAKKSARGDALVSINKASLTDIAEIKGMSLKLAERIVASRPFTSMEEVLNIKGMGPKLLEKLRKFIRL